MLSKKILFVSILATMCCSFAQAQIKATANFNRWNEYPLVKKIGVYQTPLVTRNYLQRDLPKLAQLESRSMRYEIAWGKDVYGANSITGTANDPIYNFDALDYFVDNCIDHTPTIIMSHGYSPNMIQINGDWQNPPSDYNVWARINKRFAQHWQEKAYNNMYIEVWNEPDLTNIFFRGTLDDYLKIYRYAAPAIREGYEDAKVGGPSGAGNGWHAALLESVRNNNLPLDFLSGHAYGAFAWQLDAMRTQLTMHGDKHAEMLLTEYAPYGGRDIQVDGKVERSDAAVTFFDAVKSFLEYTDLSYVTWAQYIDPCDPHSGKTFGVGLDKMGLIEANYGFRKALFNAFKLYGWMPVDRNYLSIGAPLAGMASSDENRVAVCAWNMSDKDESLSLTMKNIPFEKGTLEVYRIDQHANSWYENGTDDLIPEKVEYITIDNGQYVVEGVVAQRGVYYLQIVADNAGEAFPRNDFATLIRTNQWYESRGSNAPYALFDQKTWTARLSLNEMMNGRALVGVVAESVPDVFTVLCKTTNDLVDRNANSTLNMRIDFQDNTDAYVKSVLFHEGLYHDNTTLEMPWGTKRKPDAVVKVNSLHQLQVNLDEYKPQDFSGRIIITFDMASCGENSKANFQLVGRNTLSIATPSAINVTNSSATFDAFVNAVPEDVEQVGFYVGKTENPLSEGEFLECRIEGNRIKRNVENLDAHSNYYICSSVKLHDGTVAVSPVNMFQTLDLAARVKTYAPDYSLRTKKVLFQGKVADDNGSYVYKNGFVWAKGSDIVPTVADSKAFVSEGNSLYEYEVGNLEENCFYSVRAFGFNGGGVAYGDAKTFYTGDNTGVETLPAATDSFVIYDMQGRELGTDNMLHDSPLKGIFITKGTDGNTRKIIK